MENTVNAGKIKPATQNVTVHQVQYQQSQLQIMSSANQLKAAFIDIIHSVDQT